MNRKYLILLAIAAFASLPASAGAQAALGTAANFAVLGASTVTNTGATTIEGNLGVYPGSSVTGFPPGKVIGGTIHVTDAVALQAQTDASNAYTNLSTPCGATLAKELAGLTLTPGVYCFDSEAALNGTLTLNGDSSAVWVFRIPSTLITGSNSKVLFSGGANGCNVYWLVGSSATLGTGTQFAGNIIAQASISLTTGASITPGRALALTGAVTLDTNVVSIANCTALPAADTTKPSVTLTAVIAGPPKQLQITAQDTGSGIASIEVTQSSNSTTVIPTFTIGTTGTVVVTTTKTNQALAASVTLKVTDVAGNVTIGDPALVTVSRKVASGKTETLTGLPQVESLITVINGNPGLQNLQIEVNGVKFTQLTLQAGKTYSVDVYSAMRPGNSNTITFKATGQPGGSADIVVSD